MTIPIVIVWGHRDAIARLGWTARECPRCQIIQPFAVYSRTRAHHIYFLTVCKEQLGVLTVCDFCDSAYALKKGDTPSLDQRWTKSLGLEVLARKTNPDLLPLSTKPRPTERELFALLESTDEKGRVLEKNIRGPFILGSIICGLGTGFLFAGLRLIDYFIALDVGGFFGLGAMLGVLVGGTIWAIVAGRRKARKIMVEALRRAMTRHRLDKGALRTAFVRHSASLRRVRPILESIS